ncbi:MAG: transglycosylase SLT domain-containing protein [Chloroflexi bacterium]|nr:transglycosylase SLT domain-containing protein [Chloroflexota bacterium]
MSSRHSAPLSAQAAVSSGGGCPTGYLLPPLAVVCVGTLLMFFSLGSTNPSVPAESPDQAAEIQTSGPLLPLSSVFTPEVQYWAGRIQNWAAASGLDPNLVATVMQIESCGDPRARSRAGAMGLFQVMPYHFTASDDPYAPDTNALRGLDYLRRSLETAYGDPRLALAGYNGGIGVIDWSESGWAAETQRYAYWGSGIYAEASSGASESLRLQEWLTASGVSLCRQAHDRLGINP